MCERVIVSRCVKIYVPVRHAYLCGERHSLTFAYCYPIPLPHSRQSLSLRYLELLRTVAVEITIVSITASKIGFKKNMQLQYMMTLLLWLARLVNECNYST